MTPSPSAASLGGSIVNMINEIQTVNQDND